MEIDLATVIVLILGVIVIAPIFLVVRVFRRVHKYNSAKAAKAKYDARVVEAMDASMRTMGFKRAHDNRSRAYEKRDPVLGLTRVSLTVAPVLNIPHYTFKVRREAPSNSLLYDNKAEWKPKPSRAPVQLQPLHDMIAEAEQQATPLPRTNGRSRYGLA